MTLYFRTGGSRKTTGFSPLIIIPCTDMVSSSFSSSFLMTSFRQWNITRSYPSNPLELQPRSSHKSRKTKNICKKITLIPKLVRHFKGNSPSIQLPQLSQPHSPRKTDSLPRQFNDSYIMATQHGIRTFSLDSNSAKAGINRSQSLHECNSAQNKIINKCDSISYIGTACQYLCL